MTQFNIKLEETLFYEKLFSKCDVQKSGKVSGLEAYKLFLKSGLPIEDLRKICEYCGANRLGFFGRSQFYIALKIISIAQAGISVDENILQREVTHSTPKFDHEINEEVFKTVQKSSELPMTIPPPPNKQHLRTLSGNSILHNAPMIRQVNRYSYSSPVSERSSRPIVHKGSWDQSATWRDRGELYERAVSMDGCNTQVKRADQEDTGDDRDGEESGGESDVWDSCSEQDNKGLLDPVVRNEFDFEAIRKRSSGDSGGGVSSSSDSDSSNSDSSGDSDTSGSSGECDRGRERDNDSSSEGSEREARPSSTGGCEESAGGYTLMAAVDGLAAAPDDLIPDGVTKIPTARSDQLEYYSQCYHTLRETREASTTTSGSQVNYNSAIVFFRMHDLPDESLEKILHLINIVPDSQISLIDFSKALHLIAHFQTGFSIPDTLPENLLPVEFEQPDEPFSFDLSDGELPEVSNNYRLSSLDSSYSADGDSPSFDFTDVAVNRGWAQMKSQFVRSEPKDSRPLKSIFKAKNSDKKNSLSNSNQKEEAAEFVRPRPYAKKSLCSIPSTVAPPPPPRFSVPNELLIKKFSTEKGADPSGDSLCNISSTSTSATSNLSKDVDNNLRKVPEPVKSDPVNNVRHVSNQETRKQLQINMRELKSRNHVLLRLNNEMTSELEELREQRVNLDLQLEYIKQSQNDIQ